MTSRVHREGAAGFGSVTGIARRSGSGGRMSESISLLMFAVGPVRLGLALDAVDRVVLACEVTPLPGAPAPVLGAINLHGEIIPVLDVRLRLRLPSRAVLADDQFLMVRAGGRRYALPVDEVDGVGEFAMDQVELSPEMLDGLSQLAGAVRLPDGLLIVENPAQFLDTDSLRVLDHALQQREASDVG